MEDTASSGPMPIPGAKQPSHVARVQKRFNDIYGAAKVEREKLLETPPGWWRFCEEGSLTGVLNKLEASSIPNHAKAFLKSDLTERCSGGFNFVHVHAHYHVEAGHGVAHYDVKASTKTL